MSSEESSPTPPQAIRAEALEALLRQKGLIRTEQIDALIAEYAEQVGPLNGAKAVGRAWVDPDYKARLLSDGKAALEELGAGEAETQQLEVVENTSRLHNVVVCTLCSCYPWAVLGLPPSWYKSPEYRSRVVREPRSVLREMGLALDDDIEIRVWDSSAEIRYMVLPEQPAGTERLSEQALIELVTRDSMIGVAKVAA